MKIEMLRARLYRGEHLDVGRITDMDDATARWFIGQAWAKESATPAPIDSQAADALIPTKVTRRRAIR